MSGTHDEKLPPLKRRRTNGAARTIDATFGAVVSSGSSASASAAPPVSKWYEDPESGSESEEPLADQHHDTGSYAGAGAVEEGKEESPKPQPKSKPKSRISKRGYEVQITDELIAAAIEKDPETPALPGLDWDNPSDAGLKVIKKLSAYEPYGKNIRLSTTKLHVMDKMDRYATHGGISGSMALTYPELREASVHHWQYEVDYVTLKRSLGIVNCPKKMDGGYGCNCFKTILPVIKYGFLLVQARNERAAVRKAERESLIKGAKKSAEESTDPVRSNPMCSARDAYDINPLLPTEFPATRPVDDILRAAISKPRKRGCTSKADGLEILDCGVGTGPTDANREGLLQAKKEYYDLNSINNDVTLDVGLPTDILLTGPL